MLCTADFFFLNLGLTHIPTYHLLIPTRIPTCSDPSLYARTSQEYRVNPIDIRGLHRQRHEGRQKTDGLYVAYSMHLLRQGLASPRLEYPNARR